MHATIPLVAEGYPRIAHLMSEHRELGIFRRFEALNILSLLHMQAELMILEEKYYELASTDEKCSSRAYRSRDWWTLTQLDSTGKREQWENLLQIREKLDKYNICLQRQIDLSSRPAPNPYDLMFFRDWLTNPQSGNFPLRGLDRKGWSEEFSNDLIAIQHRSSGDSFSRWVINVFIPRFHACIGHRLTTPLHNRSEITQYKDSVIIKILNGVATIIASLIPISSIVLLYFVSSISARLGILTGFTALFSLCLVLVTSASRVEIFAATSAFAAVQVVFLSGTGGNIN